MLNLRITWGFWIFNLFTVVSLQNKGALCCSTEGNTTLASACNLTRWITRGNVTAFCFPMLWLNHRWARSFPSFMLLVSLPSFSRPKLCCYHSPHPASRLGFFHVIITTLESETSANRRFFPVIKFDFQLSAESCPDKQEKTKTFTVCVRKNFFINNSSVITVLVLFKAFFVHKLTLFTAAKFPRSLKVSSPLKGVSIH